MNKKIYKKLFGGFGFVIIVSLLTLCGMSQTYIQNLVYLSLIHIWTYPPGKRAGRCSPGSLR